MPKSDFTTPRAGPNSRVLYPFIATGDSNTRIYEYDCLVKTADYATSIPALDTAMSTAANAGLVDLPFGADSAAYFVGDNNHRQTDGGNTQFIREFARIPETRPNVFTGSAAFAFPGIKASALNGTERTITAVSTTAGVTSLTCSNTVNVGDTIFYGVTTTDGSTTLTSSGSAKALSGTTISVVKIQQIAHFSTFVSGLVTELSVQPQAQKTITTGTFTDFTYYLPGVTSGITTLSDVPETDVFAPHSTNTGLAVNTLTPDTIPTDAEYAADVSAGNYLIKESTLSTWKGNIIQRANQKVRAK